MRNFATLLLLRFRSVYYIADSIVAQEITREKAKLIMKILASVTGSKLKVVDTTFAALRSYQ